MSMIGSFRRLPQADLERLTRDSELAERYFEDELEGFGPFADTDVDKAWHGIHFLLTQTAWEGAPPLDFIARGGREIEGVDLGYGPPRAYDAAEVRAIAKALEPIDEAVLRARFDPAAMMKLEIYPTIWDRPPEEDDALGYLVAHYHDLRAFVAGAAEHGEALLVWVS